ncbi:MAG: transcription elongation factor GreA [Chloroflexota bacterium]
MPRSAKEHSSSPSQSQSNPVLGQAVASYLSGLTPELRNGYAQGLNAFVRWFGAQKDIGSITPPNLDRYQEQLTAEARPDAEQWLEALRAFLAEAKKQRWTATNLATEIKLRRKKKKEEEPEQPKAPVQVEPQPLENGAIRLTREGHDKLAAELNYLETEMRPKIAMELRTAAADKDFRENAPYDVAKHHQGEVEARIRELQRILRTGHVVEDTGPAHVADLGSRVTLLDVAEDEEIVYTLVGPGEIDPRNGKISIQSPVGKALTGKVIGDEVAVQVPAGTLRLRVQKVENR